MTRHHASPGGKDTLPSAVRRHHAGSEHSHHQYRLTTGAPASGRRPQAARNGTLRPALRIGFSGADLVGRGTASVRSRASRFPDAGATTPVVAAPCLGPARPSERVGTRRRHRTRRTASAQPASKPSEQSHPHPPMMALVGDRGDSRARPQFRALSARTGGPAQRPGRCQRVDGVHRGAGGSTLRR